MRKLKNVVCGIFILSILFLFACTTTKITMYLVDGNHILSIDPQELEIMESSDARQLILSGNAKCVVVKNGKIVSQAVGSGVSPLLEIYEKDKDLMKDAIIFDKVFGRAAAAIAVSANVKYVYSEIMSLDAMIFLTEHNIPVGFNEPVRKILNRSKTGLCPLEESVLNLNNPKDMIMALKEKIQFLKSQKKK